jgi:hypothetical protein
MSLVYQCASCEKRFKVADTSAGKRVRCTHCGTVGTVPGPGNTAAKADALPPRPVPKGAGPLPPAPARRAAAATAVAPPPPPPPRPAPAEEDPFASDPFAAMEQLEQSGQVTGNDDIGLAPPPPPPPGSRAGGGVSAPPPPPVSPQRRALQPVAKPWVPGYVSFLDFEKPLHRIALMAIFGVLCLGGIAAAVIFYSKSQKDSHFNAVARHVDGKLTGRAERHDIRRRRRLPQEAYDVKYVFQVDGRSYTGEADQVKVEDLPAEADPSHSFDGQNAMVDVQYDPDNPAENRLEEAPTAGDWLIVAIGAGATVVGLFGGWRVWRYDRYARSIGS